MRLIKSIFKSSLHLKSSLINVTPKSDGRNGTNLFSFQVRETRKESVQNSICNVIPMNKFVDFISIIYGYRCT